MKKKAQKKKQFGGRRNKTMKTGMKNIKDKEIKVK